MSLNKIKQINTMIDVVKAANERMDIINQSMYTDQVKFIQKMQLLSYTSMLLKQIKSATGPISFNTLLINNIQ